MNVDDIEVGQAVTILQWYENSKERGWEDHPELRYFMDSEERRPRRDLMGIPLRVEAKSLPYLACRVCFSNRVIVLDVREVEVTRVTEAYLKMMRLKHRQDVEARERGTHGRSMIDRFFDNYGKGA